MATVGHSRLVSRPDALTLGIFVAIVLMAGSNVVAVRFSNRELDPFWGAGLRFLLADVLLFAVVVVRRLPLPVGGALMGAVLYGLLGFGAFYALGYTGLLQVPAGMASLLLASVPILTFFLAVLHRVEAFRWRVLGGTLLALAGIGVIFAGPSIGAVPLRSMLAILVAAACAAEASVLIKVFPASHPVTTNAVGMGAGSIALLVISLAAGENWILPVRAETRVALAYLVVLGSFLLFILYLFAVKRWTATGMSYQFVLMPVVAIALSAWLDGESLGLGLLLGGFLVLFGVYLGALASPGPRVSGPVLVDREAAAK